MIRGKGKGTGMTDHKGAAAMAAHLDAGRRRIVLHAPRGRAATDGLGALLAGQGGATLVATEFETVRGTLLDLRAALGKDAVAGWGEDARVTVSNYERIGLYARFADPAAFDLVVLLPHRPENARSAAAVAEHFSPAAMLQVTRDGDAAFAPDHSARFADLPPPAPNQDNVAPLRAVS